MDKKIRNHLPWVSRFICRYLWHSYLGDINKGGSLEWLACTRCGHQLRKVCTGVYMTPEQEWERSEGLLREQNNEID